MKDRGLHNIPHCRTISCKMYSTIKIIFWCFMHWIVERCDEEIFSAYTNKTKTLVMKWLQVFGQPLFKRPIFKCSWIMFCSTMQNEYCYVIRDYHLHIHSIKSFLSYCNKDQDFEHQFIFTDSFLILHQKPQYTWQTLHCFFCWIL